MFYLEENYVTCEDCEDGLEGFPDAVQGRNDDLEAQLGEYCGSSFQGFDWLNNTLLIIDVL